MVLRLNGFRLLLTRRGIFASTSHFAVLRCLASNQREPYVPVPMDPVQPLWHRLFKNKIIAKIDCHKTLYEAVCEQLRNKIDLFLAIALALFITSFSFGLYDDLNVLESIKTSFSDTLNNYRKRKIYKEKLDNDKKVSASFFVEAEKKYEALPIIESSVATKGHSVINNIKEIIFPSKREKVKKELNEKVCLLYKKLPEEIPYLLIGGGAASYYAAITIRGRDPCAKVLMIGDELELPYDRTPLSKNLWWSGADDASETLRYKTASGRTKNIFFENANYFVPPDEINGTKHGGISLVMGHRVTKLDPEAHIAYLDDGRTIKYKKCLIATGGSPRKLAVIEQSKKDIKERVMYFRVVDDFKKLYKIADGCRSITIIGSGLLGTELAIALNTRFGPTGLIVNQVFPENGNLRKIFPDHLSQYTTMKLQNNGIRVITGQNIVQISKDDGYGCLMLHLSSGEVIKTDFVVAAVGIVPNTELAASSGLEIDKNNDGFIVDAELRARSDIWVAGDASSFYDIKHGRRRLEHQSNSEATGRLAGFNMTGGNFLIFYVI
ncbi:unnamed protein product [Dracunculus medinensis]|uniref:Pyr_redox_2 domain-containing protein n=1 Tax=Dracunculus medinensis TaxID=318479 RepID=A0A0N4UAC5_DRAME|nr:unnamed protein product [Dracunculus medinensis]